MSSYLPGNTDYIPQIQPFRPDYNFIGNILQSKQSQYDVNKRKVSDLYGTLLNSPLLKDSNIKRRDEFFKVIDEDIKKISGLDLSLEQNVNAAQKVFKSFYDDKYMVNDMIKTKNAYNELEKGNAFKSCTDPVKCGGVFSETSMKAIQYKMQEFKESSDEESLNFEMGKFTPKYLWQKDALDVAAKAGLKVKRDTVTNNWIVTQQNGELVQGGLYSLFKSEYGDDPRVAANYADEAYVNRKEYSDYNASQHGSKEQAEEYYINNVITTGLKAVSKDLKNTSDSYSQVISRERQLLTKQKNGTLNNKEKEILSQIQEEKGFLENNKNSLQASYDDIQNNLEAKDIRSLRYRADRAAAAALEQTDMQRLAETLALKDAEIKYEANPYGLKAVDFSNQARLKQIDNYYNRNEKVLQNALDKDKELYKFQLENGLLGGEQAPETSETAPEGGNIIKADLEKDPSIIYNENKALNSGNLIESEKSSLNFLYDLYNKAKVELKKDPNSEGAKQFLENNFLGKEVKSVNDLKNNLKNKNIFSTFKTITETLPEEKNPKADIAWAQNVINANRVRISEIQLNNKAALLKFTNTQKVTKNILDKLYNEADQANPHRAFINLIPKDEFIYDYASPKFIQKFIKSYPGASEKDAVEVYDKIREEFLPLYNTAKNTNDTQAAGLEGVGMTQRNVSTFRNVNPLSETGQNVISTISNALADEGSASFVIGDATTANYNDGKSDEAVKTLFNMLTSDLNKKGKDRPIDKLDVKISPTAASKEGLSAITLNNIPEKYKKELIGTKENKGILYGTDISQGITMFYNNKTVKNRFQGSEISNLQSVLINDKHYSIDEFKEFGGTVDFTYNEITKQVDVSHDLIWLDENNNPKSKSYESFPVSLKDVDAIKNNILSEINAQYLQNLKEFNKK
jgi:hypothetical protein